MLPKRIDTMKRAGVHGGFKKGSIPVNKGIKRPGTRWFNNGVINTRAFECPSGFEAGKLTIQHRSDYTMDQQFVNIYIEKAIGRITDLNKAELMLQAQLELAHKLIEALKAENVALLSRLEDNTKPKKTEAK